MSVLGTVESLWRYPVKSMKGEPLDQAFIGFSGVYGDRVYAFTNESARKGFPYFTARDQRRMLLYTPRFRNPAAAAQPINWKEANVFGATPLYAEPGDWMMDVMTPSGETFAIDDPALMDHLRNDLTETATLSLLRSERALTDCRPVSLFSLQTVQQIGDEVGTSVDYRRFRANLYLNLESGTGFEEDSLVGRQVRIGSQVVIAVLARDTRCQMITLDPETGISNPMILRQVAQNHESKAGVYGAVLVEGTVEKGDPVELLETVIP